MKIFKSVINSISIKLLKSKLKKLKNMAGDIDTCLYYSIYDFPDTRKVTNRRTIIQLEIESIEDKLTKLTN